MPRKAQILTSLIVNAFITVITIVIVVSYFFEGPSALMQHSYETFRFFTTDSNILAALCSLIMVVCDIRLLLHKTDTLPKSAVLLKYIGTVSVMLTFCTTVLFLVPMHGASLVSGSYFFVHVSTPLLSLLTLVLTESVCRIRFPAVFLSMIPMMLYGSVYFTNVVIIGSWRDFYSFNRNGHWLVTTIIMTVSTFIIALLTLLVHNLMYKKLHKISSDSISN